jgi:hypothetical protein
VTVPAGLVVTLKSPAWVPLRSTLLMLRSAVPEFSMVKVRSTVPLSTSVEPKSV